MRDAQMLAARAAGHSPDGTVEYPPIGDGLILTGSPGAGSYFPQPVADEARLDDVLGAGHWLIDRAALDAARTRPVPRGTGRTGWMRSGAEAVLVRPDRYVFGTGRARMTSPDAWAEAVG
jgi:3-(3-hydroxy-phenyl)propionate hydroxylase